VKLNLEQKIKEFVEESFKKDELIYRNVIESHIKDGLEFEYSFKKIEDIIYKKLDDEKFNPDYKDLAKSLEKIKKNYGNDEFNKTITSGKFQEELKIKNTTVDQFIHLHKEYLAENEVLKFHDLNREIFKRYFMIKYSDEQKYKIYYSDLKLFHGGEDNNSLVNKEVNRLDSILKPQSKSKNYKLKKYGKDLTTQDIAVFMILFKAYYKIKVDTQVEFVNIIKLFFDDLHYNMEAGDPTRGTSIEWYLIKKKLYKSKFNFEESREKVLGILSNINLKNFKKYVENVEEDKFKSLLS